MELSLLFINPVIDQTHQIIEVSVSQAALENCFALSLTQDYRLFLKNKEVLHPSQIGFLPGNRTADHM